MCLITAFIVCVVCVCVHVCMCVCVCDAGRTIAGTTDTATELSDHPQPKEEDVRFILKEIKNYLSPDISG